MDIKKNLLTASSAAAALALLRSSYEVRNIKSTVYKISSGKIAAGKKINFVFLCDLHCRMYGEKNIRLLRAVNALKPDFIVSGGDMITASKGSAELDEQVLCFLKALKKIAPVYYAMGNHEEYLRAQKSRFKDRYEKIETSLAEAGIPLLRNGRIDLENNISIYGLEISGKYYRRFSKKKPKPRHMQSYLGKPDKERYNILLAHNPEYFDVYETWKPDLVLSGHYHGGIIGMPDLKHPQQRRGLISPHLKIFPDYCAGKFKKNDTDLIVSAGCGSHSINFRLFNMPEVISIELSSETEQL